MINHPLSVLALKIDIPELQLAKGYHLGFLLTFSFNTTTTIVGSNYKPALVATSQLRICAVRNDE